MNCRPNRSIHIILNDQVGRGKIYHEILKNEVYRAELIDSLRTNRNTRLLVNTGNLGDSLPVKKINRGN